jgi:hypothetical protein
MFWWKYPGLLEACPALNAAISFPEHEINTSFACEAGDKNIWVIYTNLPIRLHDEVLRHGYIHLAPHVFDILIYSYIHKLTQTHTINSIRTHYIQSAL